MKVTVVAEFYPRRGDPVLGIWAHRQALAARDAGAEVRVVVLHRLVPPRASFSRGPAGSGGPARALRSLAREPHKQTLDGLDVTYVRYVSPPRSGSYPAWGAWAAPALGLALRRLRRSFAFDLVHAHNAVPAGDAAQRVLTARPRALGVPLVVSVHGGDVLYTAPRGEAGAEAVRRTFGAATTVLANSRGIAELASSYGANDVRVVHLGADLPARVAGGLVAGGQSASGAGTGGPGGERPERRDTAPSLVTAGHLVARKRHADVMRALAVLAKRYPALRYTIVGDGPERVTLEGLATRLGVAERVDFHGQLAPEQAIEQVRACTLFAMPSTEEAFGVAYIEAMAGGIPAIGCRGEPGPEEIAAAGDGFVLVPPGDIERLTQRIDELLSDPQRLREAGIRARETVAANFTWERCGEQTVAAYEHALAHASSDPETDPGSPRKDRGPGTSAGTDASTSAGDPGAPR
jgi:glycosyltransferase involved in cell wall biosynthesis